MGVKRKIDYVYILGASHSGTTLLAMLLNAHPDITTIGESSPGRIGDSDTYLCSCGALIKDCSFWRRVVERMREDHPDFSLNKFGTRFEFPLNPVVNRFLGFEHRGFLCEFLRDTFLRFFPHWKEAQRHIMNRCCALASAVLAESGGRIFVDSSKVAHRLKFLLRIPELNVKVVHLVRDGKAVALTYMRQDEFADSEEPFLRRGGRGMEGKATAASLSMKRAANEWCRCLRSAEHVIAGLEKPQWIQVHYEELCGDTEGTLARVFKFLGLDPGKRAKDFRTVENHVVGNGMRLDTTSKITLDERWRSVLTDQDLRIFDREAGRMNRRYGYSDNGI